MQEVNTIKAINIRFSDELHKALKIKMAQEENSIQNYIIDLVKRDMQFEEESEEK